MSTHHHNHAGDHAHAHSPSRGLHKDWRTWLVVVLMLAGIATYVLSFDEEDQPGGGTAAPVPAAAE